MTATLQRSIVVEQQAVEQAKEAERRIEHSDALAVLPASGQPVKLPRELADLLSQIISTVSAGGTVTVGMLPAELTTTEAAGQLGVSRTTLMKMIRRGDIEAHKVGSHARLHAENVQKFRKRRRAQQLAALSALRDLDEEMGLDT